jgi:hypothetical protein
LAITSFFALRSDAACAFAPLGQRFGEVREQHREPQPQRDREDEARGRLGLAGERRDPQDGRQDAADVHENITGLRSCVRGVSFLNESTIAGAAAPDRTWTVLRNVESWRSLQSLQSCQRVAMRARHAPSHIIRCSTPGPSASAGT